ncbi:conserved hypothetical protein [Methylobacterium sp. 4-46]|uniref:DUF2939 domain-containing protein n=1 Tax=unclassified Methylobacterium TaxID=2615210 RepID=UPI000152CB28|nr:MULTISPECIES: DUF2939 domain-containing protein [Methylobacterium]ACA18575.1 conserved hypothetical protein [Methylobacterium sp. 4-46]WFT77858.1 DUF2939 domain-containing protein [Methylobacterium nodulans]
MRWWCLFLALVLLWLGYSLSPYLALYRLSEAVRTNDLPAVTQRVNFRTLRLSLSRQATAAALEAIEARPDLSPRDRQMLTDAVAGLVEPVVGSLVTPEMLMDLLDDGWPERLGIARPDGAAGPGRGSQDRGLPGRRVSDLLALARTAEMRGFRGVVFSFPPDRPRASQYRLRLRLRGFTWRVVDLELPADLRDRISQKLVRLPLPGRAEPRPAAQ